MTKLSDILSKRVVSLYNGRIEGIVSNTYFNANTQKLKLIEIIDDIGENEEQLFNTQNIFHIGNDAVMVKNNEKFELKLTTNTNGLYTPMNKCVYDTKGNNLGYITDVELNNNYSAIKLYTSSNYEFEVKKIINISNETIIINVSDKKVCISNFRYRKKPIDNIINLSQIVSIMPEPKTNNETENGTDEGQQENKQMNYILNTEKPNPTRLLAKYDFLLGRQVINNITNENNVVVIKKNTKINARIIEVACAATKIRELILNSK